MSRAQELDQVGRLLGRAEPVHRDVAFDNLRRARRQDRRVDLAGRDRVDPHAERRQVVRHFARQAPSAAFDVAYAEPANGCTRDAAIDVRLTTAPRAFASSDAKPRVISSGA